MIRGFKFDRDENPEELASNFLKFYFGEDLQYPIDPFIVLSTYNVYINLGNFKKLEGVYIPPEDDNDIIVIGINNKRPIYRQRYTAAHELCHIIKNDIAQICDTGSKNPIERFAEDFAAAFLMPECEMRKQIIKYEENGYISFENVLLIADYFAVSFQSCVLRLAWKFRKIDGDVDYKQLSKRISKFMPDVERQKLGLFLSDTIHIKNMLNNVFRFFLINLNNSMAVQLRYKNDFIYNEAYLEGIDLDYQQVVEIITDIRLYKQHSMYCTEKDRKVVEIVGHSAMYDFIFETDEIPTIYSLLKLNKMLYSFTPYPEYGGKTREINTLVSGAKFDAVDHSLIGQELINLSPFVNEIVKNKDKLSISDFIDEVLKIHHRITVIHPFSDGNGRTSRVFINWLFKLKGLPPVYLHKESKTEYLSALKEADKTNQFCLLQNLFYKEVISSYIQLNEHKI